MKHLRSIHLSFVTLVVGVLALVAACTTMGLQTPDTFNKRAAAAYTTVQGIANTATAAIQAGKLSKADAINVVTTTRAAITAIDLAISVHATKPQVGEDKLAATLSILTALQAYLATQGAN